VSASTAPGSSAVNGGMTAGVVSGCRPGGDNSLGWAAGALIEHGVKLLLEQRERHRGGDRTAPALTFPLSQHRGVAGTLPMANAIAGGTGG